VLSSAESAGLIKSAATGSSTALREAHCYREHLMLFFVLLHLFRKEFISFIRIGMSRRWISLGLVVRSNLLPEGFVCDEKYSQCCHNERNTAEYRSEYNPPDVALVVVHTEGDEERI